MDDARNRRSLERAKWPGGLTTLEEQTDAAVISHGSPGDRVAMLWRLSLDAWAMSGRSMPTYERAEMPGRLVRPPDG